MKSSKSRTPNTEHRTPNTKHQTPNTEHQTPNTEHRTPNSEFRVWLMVIGLCLTAFSYPSKANAEQTSIAKSALKSAVFPGWGQISQGKNIRAGLMSTFYVSSLAGIYLASTAKTAAYEKYRLDTETAPLEHHFNLATKYYRVQTFCTFVSIGIWTWSVIDAFFSGPKETELREKNKTQSLNTKFVFYPTGFEIRMEL